MFICDLLFCNAPELDKGPQRGFINFRTSHDSAFDQLSPILSVLSLYHICLLISLLKWRLGIEALASKHHFITRPRDQHGRAIPSRRSWKSEDPEKDSSQSLHMSLTSNRPSLDSR